VKKKTFKGGAPLSLLPKFRRLCRREENAKARGKFWGELKHRRTSISDASSGLGKGVQGLLIINQRTTQEGQSQPGGKD